MKTVYSENCLFHASVYEWYKRFRKGHEDIKYGEQPNPKHTVVSERNIETVRITRAGQ